MSYTNEYLLFLNNEELAFLHSFHYWCGYHSTMQVQDMQAKVSWEIRCASELLNNM